MVKKNIKTSSGNTQSPVNYVELLCNELNKAIDTYVNEAPIVPCSNKDAKVTRTNSKKYLYKLDNTSFLNGHFHYDQNSSTIIEINAKLPVIAVPTDSQSNATGANMMDQQTADKIISSINSLTVAVENINQNVIILSNRVTVLEDRMTGLETRMTGLENRMSNLETRMTKLEDYVVNMEKRINKRLDVITEAVIELQDIAKKHGEVITKKLKKPSKTKSAII